MLFLDGVYVSVDSGNFAFHYNKAPTVEQLTDVLHIISQRVTSFLERRGLLERDEDNSYLILGGLDEDPLHDIQSLVDLSDSDGSTAREQGIHPRGHPT